ncbi:hypothetical protein T484DRAFT_1819780 [Baffinella frigidus]|nr:hypothetical protein T484DRAFT_1819780 [Cryptophyta sp. CCMP2293]
MSQIPSRSKIRRLPGANALRTQGPLVDACIDAPDLRCGIAKRVRIVKGEFIKRKCLRTIPQVAFSVKSGSRIMNCSSAVHNVLDTMLEEEEEQEEARRSGGAGADFFALTASMTEYQRELWELRVGEARRQGVSILFTLANLFGVDTSTDAFALSVSLLQRCLTTPKLSHEQRSSLELPLACFLLATKYADGRPPGLTDLCACLPGVDIHPRTVCDLELAVLQALNWKIDTVCAAHILRQAVSLAPPQIIHAWRASLHFHLDLYHADVSSDFAHHRQSAAASGIIALVAHKAGYDAQSLAAWLPHEMLPPLHRMAESDAAGRDTPSGALGEGVEGVCGGGAEGGGAARRERETLWCVGALRGALAVAEPDVIQREASASPPLWCSDEPYGRQSVGT